MDFPQSFVDATLRQVKENGPLMWNDLTPSHQQVLRKAAKGGKFKIDTDPETHELSVWWTGPKMMDGKHGRGSGRTFQALKAAPEGALFVVGSITDARKAATIHTGHFSDKDIEIIVHPSEQFDGVAAVTKFSANLADRAEREMREIVCDHSYNPSPAEQLNYMYAMRTVTGKPLPGDLPEDWNTDWIPRDLQRPKPPSIPARVWVALAIFGLALGVAAGLLSWWLS
jgi:hypothetical protein